MAHQMAHHDSIIMIRNMTNISLSMANFGKSIICHRKRNISHKNFYSTSNDSLDYSTSSGLDIQILRSYSGSYIPILELEQGFPYICHRGEAISLTTCNMY